MEPDSSLRDLQFLFVRENQRAGEQPNTPFLYDLLVDLDSSSL